MLYIIHCTYYITCIYICYILYFICVYIYIYFLTALARTFKIILNNYDHTKHHYYISYFKTNSFSSSWVNYSN